MQVGIYGEVRGSARLRTCFWPTVNVVGEMPRKGSTSGKACPLNSKRLRNRKSTCMEYADSKSTVLCACGVDAATNARKSPSVCVVVKPRT